MRIFFCVQLLICIVILSNAQIYVAPNGCDSNSGTVSHAVATFAKAQQLASFFKKLQNQFFDKEIANT